MKTREGLISTILSQSAGRSRATRLSGRRPKFLRLVKGRRIVDQGQSAAISSS
jgi:hypothetical protein